MAGKEFLKNYTEQRLPEFQDDSTDQGPDNPWFTNDMRDVPLQRPPYPV